MITLPFLQNEYHNPYAPYMLTNLHTLILLSYI